MTIHDRILEEAMGLMSLSASDADRQDAERHAGSCDACQAALREAGEMIALLDVQLRAEPPSLELAGRIRSALANDPDRDALARPPLRSRHTTAAWTLLTFGVLMFLEDAAHAPAVPLVYGLVLGIVAVGIASCAHLRGRRFVGYALACAALGAGIAGSWASPPQDLGLSLGLQCFALELCAALLPLSGALYVVARRRARDAGATLAGAAAAGAMTAQAALLVGCPHRGLAHLLTFHAGAVFVAALLGTGVGAVLPRAWRPASA